MPRTVLVVTSDVPLVEGGHRVIARELTAALQRAGHRAELRTTPQNRFGAELSAYAATWLTDLGQTGYGDRVDRVITLRFPSYALRHDDHVCWLVHRQREYYDLWERFAETLDGERLFKQRLKRRAIHWIDRQLLRRVRRLYAISGTVAARLERWGGHAATSLHPPPPERPYRTDSYEPFVLSVSRLDRWKRVDLLIRALARTPGLGAVVAGDGPERGRLEELARELKVDGRVRLEGSVSEQRLIELYGRCRAVFFAPYQEDYGFVTAEAFRSRKPVVTCDDAGGVTELVRDGVNGFVTPPEPRYVAQALHDLGSDERLAEKLGEAGYASVAGLTWESAAAELMRE